MNRRTFLKGSAATVAAGLGAKGAHVKPVAPSDHITLGYIGVGRMGRNNIRHQLEIERSNIAAICDVYEPSITAALEEFEESTVKPPDVVSDFRRILDRKDIDAVVVSTPDHWHAAQTILACQAGKDVFVEKPLATSIVEGRRMIEVAKDTGRIVQMGTMQRSAEHFQRAVEIVKSGILGKVTYVRTWNIGNEAPDGFGMPDSLGTRDGLDWDAWLGPAPYREFDSNRFGVGDRWSTFRYFWDYAGGMLTDWGVHLMDIAVWAMGDDIPKSVTTSGGKYLMQDNRDTPDTLQTTYEFDGWVMTYTNLACNDHGFGDRGYGILFHGTEGTLFVDRGGYELTPEFVPVTEDSVERRPKTQSLAGRSNSSGNLEHHHNWLDCIQSRSAPICDVEIGHRSSVLSHLGNIAYRSGTRIDWDGKAEVCRGNDRANAFLGCEYREPWKSLTFG